MVAGDAYAIIPLVIYQWTRLWYIVANEVKLVHHDYLMPRDDKVDDDAADFREHGQLPYCCRNNFAPVTIYNHYAVKVAKTSNGAIRTFDYYTRRYKYWRRRVSEIGSDCIIEDALIEIFLLRHVTILSLLSNMAARLNILSEMLLRMSSEVVGHAAYQYTSSQNEMMK